MEKKSMKRIFSSDLASTLLTVETKENNDNIIDIDEPVWVLPTTPKRKDNISEIEEYKADQSKLKSSISLIKSHHRTNIIKALFLPFIPLGSAFFFVADKIKFSNTLQASYNLAYNIVTHTWGNFSIINYESVSLERLYGYKMCFDIPYPVIRAGSRHYLHYCNRGGDYNCCYLASYYDRVDLTNSTGLEECYQVVKHFCSMYYPYAEDNSKDDTMFWVCMVGLVILALITLGISHFCFTSQPQLKKLSLKPDEESEMYVLATKYKIFTGDRHAFKPYLSLHFSKLQEGYITALENLDDYYSRYFSRFIFMTGFSRAPKNKSSMRKVCISDKENSRDVDYAKEIFEFADIDKDGKSLIKRTFRNDTLKMSRIEQIRAAQNPEYKIKDNSLQRFFQKLETTYDDTLQQPLYDKKKILETIYKFI